MKRYLARLAERATLATAPVTPAAGASPIADPFETVAPMEQTPVPSVPRKQETAPPTPPRPQIVETAAPVPPPVAEQVIVPKLETVVHERIVETPRLTAPPPATRNPQPATPTPPAPPTEEPPTLQPPPPERVTVQTTT